MNTLASHESPAPMPRKKLPIGIQTFAKIRENDYYYVDKTGIAVDLIARGSYYFLSRPRRFGKSLFLDTLKELFEGNFALFKGLEAETKWDWSKIYPVIRISFTGGVLRNRIEQDSQQTLGVCCQHKSVSGQFGELIALTHKMLDTLVQSKRVRIENRTRLYDILDAHNLSAMQELFTAFFDSIPTDWYRNNPIANYEGYYAGVFYSYFAALGLNITVEDSSNKGRLDMAVRFQKRILLFEFKVVELVPEGRALAQLKAKNYAAKYRSSGCAITLIGVEFSRDARNIVAFEAEELTWV
jgi:hypothetical protein